MIDSKNQSTAINPNISDFTINKYQELLVLAKKNYNFVSYQNINFNQKFVLWRHDCDFSLNRALKLAELEKRENIVTTYFINLHCEFYNLFEREQSEIIRQIINLGHNIGIHFDINYYNVKSEEDLKKWLIFEKNIFIKLFNIKPIVFSFHNPNLFSLSFEKKKYTGLINCYSKQFKNNVGYISDSNGYWRFKRLSDVLSLAKEKNIQVLTHPAWWQDVISSPYDRIQRCVKGRAKNILDNYNEQLKKDGRINFGKEKSKDR
ncbi:MAG: hypothetical protein CMF98_07190 [Candidatus Marinimicrobia bacterium]|nr:hypothetical protein [Candidatus Neomarinimicrobiota bacterium]|tara:strand:+ start:6142 stop:6927 length:786 start_codon:yes stop_codon:yes gene_type:complete